MLRFHKATYFSLLFKFILSERLSNSLWVSDVLLFSKFINIVSILFHNFIEFIKLLYTFLKIYFAQYKEYIICLISFSKFSDVLPVFTCASAIGILWSICLGLNILRFEWSETLSLVRSETLRLKTLAMVATSEKHVCAIWLEIFCSQKHEELFLYPQKEHINFLWILRFYFTPEIHNFN